MPMLLDRLDYMQEHAAATRFESGGRGLHELWESADSSPSELLRRHFWFCTIDDPSGLVLRERIGVDHIMLECDYPHSDSTWPDTQLVAERRLTGLPDHEVQMITHRNACELFRFPVPGRPRASAAA